MTRSAARPGANITTAPPAAPVDPSSAVQTEAPNAAGLSRGWRVAFFMWASAFICLLIYELLNILVRWLL